MRRLILLRHAKSAWNEPALDDFDRPLASRGRKVAPLVGGYIEREKLRPDYALISPSRRTCETWQLLGPLSEAVRHGFDKRIYEASLHDLLAVTRDTPDRIETLMIVGHNPGLQTLATHLARSDRTTARRALEQKFPTAALCVLDFDLDAWAGLSKDIGVIERFVTPRGLGFSDDED